MATADNDPIEIVIVDDPKPPKPRYTEEGYDIHISNRMTLRGSNFDGLKHLQPLRGFLEQVANGG
jgi:hypothetical protein